MKTFTVSTRWHDPLEIVAGFREHGRLEELKRVYGFLFDSPLNGGRLRRSCVSFPMEVIDELNGIGVGYSFTLSNICVAREHLEDPHTNRVLERYENPLNGVIVAHDAVADYIRRHYPRYKLRASCIYNYLTSEEINDACERFDEVCVFPEVNHQPETLSAIRHKEKLTLFCTSICLNLCGVRRMSHYYLLGQDHIAWYNHVHYKIPYDPRSFEKPHMPWCRAKETTPTMHDMDALCALGFERFKVTQWEMFKNAYFLGKAVDGAKLTRRRLKAARRLFGSGSG